MSKVINVVQFDDKNNQSIAMKLTMKKDIEGESFEERSAYVKKILAKDEHLKGKTYYVSWKEYFGYVEGFLNA
jgi:hypothetical protein